MTGARFNTAWSVRCFECLMQEVDPVPWGEVFTTPWTVVGRGRWVPGWFEKPKRGSNRPMKYHPGKPQSPKLPGAEVRPASRPRLSELCSQHAQLLIDRAATPADLASPEYARALLEVVQEQQEKTRASRSVTKQCANCYASFRPKRADAAYCSSSCRQRAYRRRERMATGRPPSPAMEAHDKVRFDAWMNDHGWVVPD